MSKTQPHSPRLNRPRRTVSIIGTGSYLPERVLTNHDLEKMVETSDDWITSRTGIKERRIAAPGETTSDMASQAALAALEQAQVKPEEVDLILVATISPDMLFPATACFVQKKIGAVNAACFDVLAACSGFIYAVEIAQQFITSHTYETILVIGAEKLSSIVDWTDRNTCVLFGDGAGAAVLKYKAGSHGVITTYMGSDGAYSDILALPSSSCSHSTPENPLAHHPRSTIKMLGKEVYKQAVNAMHRAARTALEDCRLTIDDIACIIPHQANMRIIEAIADRLEVPLDRFFINLDKYGNTSAGAVAIALDEANRSGRIQPGDYILLVVFGGGLTWASSVIQW